MVSGADLGPGWGKTGFIQSKSAWVSPRAISYGSGTQDIFHWVHRGFSGFWYIKNHSRISNVESLGDKKILGEF
jgi:hypothetical protein